MCKKNCDTDIPAHYPPCIMKEILQQQKHRVSPDSSSRRKRVRFQHTVVPDILEYRPLCAEFSEEEKSTRWIQQADRKEMQECIADDARECRKEDNIKVLRGQSHLSFAETYTNVFYVCHNSSGSKSFESLLSPDIISILALNEGARGLEDRIVPHVAIERRLVRRKSILAVCAAFKMFKEFNQEQAECHVNPEQNAAEHICTLSESLTAASRKFAEVLGHADATAAMLDYAKWMEEEENEIQTKRGADYGEFSDVALMQNSPKKQRIESSSTFTLSSTALTVGDMII